MLVLIFSDHMDACGCYLPGCPLCAPTPSRRECECYFPGRSWPNFRIAQYVGKPKSHACPAQDSGCAICGSSSDIARSGEATALDVTSARLISSGTALSPEVLQLIAKVDYELGKAVDDKILSKGSLWETLPSLLHVDSAAATFGRLLKFGGLSFLDP